MKIFKYKNYDDYLQNQMQHKRTKYRTKEKQYSKYIEIIKKSFPECRKILCVGARDISEVLAFRQAGFEAIGIDLFSDDDKIIKIIDMHKIIDNFDENEFDIVFSCHSLEHSYDPKSVLKQFRKVSKLGSFIVLPHNSETDSKDPVVFEFMKTGQSKGEGVTKEMIESELSKLIEEKIEVNFCEDNQPKHANEYWITLIWNENTSL